MNPTLASLFPNASASTVAANPQLVARNGGSGKQNDSTGILEPTKGKRGFPNKTESEFALILEAMKRKGEILRYEFQGLTLRWQSGDDIIRYTPDFIVFPIIIAIHEPMRLIEVKGGYSKMPGYLERAVERFRHARTFWPQFEFELHKKTKEGWKKIL